MSVAAVAVIVVAVEAVVVVAVVVIAAAVIAVAVVWSTVDAAPVAQLRPLKVPSWPVAVGQQPDPPVPLLQLLIQYLRVCWILELV